MNFQIFTIFIVIFSLAKIQYVNAEDSDKPKLKFILDSFTKDEESTDFIKTDITFDKSDEVVLANGNIQLLADLDNDFMFVPEILYAKEVNGEYRKAFGLQQKGACDAMEKYYKNFFESLKNYSNAPEPTACPVQSQTIHINNYPLDVSSFKTFMKPGYFRAIMVLSKNDEVLFKYIIDGHVEEE